MTRFRKHIILFVACYVVATYLYAGDATTVPVGGGLSVSLSPFDKAIMDTGVIEFGIIIRNDSDSKFSIYNPGRPRIVTRFPDLVIGNGFNTDNESAANSDKFIELVMEILPPPGRRGLSISSYAFTPLPQSIGPREVVRGGFPVNRESYVVGVNRARAYLLLGGRVVAISPILEFEVIQGLGARSPATRPVH